MIDGTETDAQRVGDKARWDFAQGLMAASKVVEYTYSDDFLALLSPPDDMPAETRRDLEALAAALRPVHDIAQRLTASIDEGEPGCVAVLGAPRWHGGSVSYSRCFHGEWLHRDGSCWGCSDNARKHEYTAGVGCRNPIHWTDDDDDTPPVECSHCLDSQYVALPALWTTVVGDEDGEALDRLLARARERWAAWRADGHPYVDTKGMGAEEASPHEDAFVEGLWALCREVIPQEQSKLMSLAMDPRVWELEAELTETLSPRDVVTGALERLVAREAQAFDEEQGAQAQELAEVAR